MCGRATYKPTWAEIVALYRLTLGPAPHNFRPRFNVCPTTTIDAIVADDGKRKLMRARWGPIPGWWSKPLKELKLTTLNARAETVAEKPFFRVAGGPRPDARPARRKGLRPVGARGSVRVEILKPAPNDLLQKWPVSKRVNSSRAEDDDPTLIEKVELASV
jgi:putative SOS response-associated peptidase YedK